MQKVRRRHKLPLHPSDGQVITCQQDHLRRHSPHLFHEDGRPRSTCTVLFPTPRRSRANALGERPYDSSTIGYWLQTWLDQFAVTAEQGKPFDPARVLPYALRHTYAQLRADGHGCPVYNGCFSCTFYTTDFTHLPELRQLRTGKAEQLAALESAYGGVLTAGPLNAAGLELLRQEVQQIDERVGKCEADISSLTPEKRTT
ncbi:hypothetical protein [Streptomyces sp. NPDC090135]|uniref:hypothetical protein n=1 Tax=Streptomyces sp. NPDC090135 TaxID=3365957 RepID=UPI003830B4DB